ncbi:hypothetical protein [Mycolicibacterium rhodesiae]|uniref:Uncharacterized protein n=1 Tax=Mycolicibacterium rhodesiae TaxID=36814 RepID=A0A1X0J354_MYCRH|nr:hypothetical protein [Mycolicibacterium rhodesiae]MCV7344626.1 hypothetical protein [Mycolicibacterium rhodesiae]ORB55893.1 hypothetical protein BST42_05695 [Mycolicibacterium rhodesiae]
MTANDAGTTDNRLGARCAAVASIGAAVIHFAVAPMHWNDWVPSGVFFAAIGVFQLAWGFFAWSRPTRLLLAAGIAANVGLAALWVISRTAGAPFGPNAGEAESVEAAGICVLLLQCYVVMGAAWVLRGRYRAHMVSGLGRTLVLVGANTVMALAVTAGLASGLNGHQHHHGAPVDAEAGGGSAQETHAVTGHGSGPAATEQGRPVTDMKLNTGADHAPSSPDGHQHAHHG